MHSRSVCRVQIRYKPINNVEVSWYAGVRVLLSSGGFVGLGVANNANNVGNANNVNGLAGSNTFKKQKQQNFASNKAKHYTLKTLMSRTHRKLAKTKQVK